MSLIQMKHICQFVIYLAFLFEYKIELRSFKSSEHINERRDGPYHGFGYLSLFSDSLDLAKWGQR